MNEQDKRLDGPDVLVACVYGNDIPALKMAALDHARKLYGPDAPLRIERVEHIQTSGSEKGAFYTHVHVRCLDLPEGDL